MKKNINIRQDNRGKLIEIFKGDFAQCNVLEMKKGSVWGGHYHKKTEELFFVHKGKLLVNQKSIGKRSKRSYTKTYKEGDVFAIKLYTLHTATALEKTICVVLYSVPFNRKKPDVFHDC